MLATYFPLLLALNGSLSAQQMSHPVAVSRDDSFTGPLPYRFVSDSVKLLAVMVQFQQDNDARTTGDGGFQLGAPAEPVIDAPPHDRQYFQDHLAFLSNYYRKTSKNKLIISSTLVDSVITLPGVMSVYSPPKTGSNIAVGELVRNAWQKVDSAGLVPDFSQYNCFAVFHAGAGRDIDLVGILGYDPTPFDIPSLYLGINAFKEFYGQAYQGIAVNKGTFFITNSIVIPETESRLLPTVTGGNTLLELGINGLLCASVGNFLGLPDLFDTKTGRTGIGRFGLMDGQAIFSFSGAFPPEPSAWEKYWLGWVQPITVASGEQTIALPAVALQDSIYRIPISGEEYFLVENRNRDPLGNGDTIISRYNGVQRVQTFARDTTGFNAFDISALEGTIIDVEDLDWSLPGGLSSDGIFFDGGVLIWHIDESVIRSNLDANAVNANPKRRGVDLEEADGSQDIGQDYGFLSPGSGSEEGTPLDFWYAGNSSPVFKNVFSPTSHPNSNSYAGANSHITIRDFSARGSRMTAAVSVGDGGVTLLPGFPKGLNEILPSHSLTVSSLGASSSPALVVATTGMGDELTNPRLSAATPLPGKLFAWSLDGTRAFPEGFTSGLIASAQPLGPPTTQQSGFLGGVSINDLNSDGISEIIAGQEGTSTSLNALRAFSAIDVSPKDSLADDYFGRGVGRSITAPAVAGDSLIAFGTSGGMVYFARFDGSIVDSVQVSTESNAIVSGISRLVGANTFIITCGGTVTITSRSTSGGTTAKDIVRSFEDGISGAAVAGSFLSPGDVRIAFGTGAGFLFLVDGQLDPCPGFPIDTKEPGLPPPEPGAMTSPFIQEPPALADVDGDGIRDIVVFSRDRMCVYNISGASLDYFPIKNLSGAPFISAPVVADVDGDGSVEVIGASIDGLVVAYDRSARPAPGFPLQAGTGGISVLAFEIPSPSLSEVGIGIAAGSDRGSVCAWKTGSVHGPGAAVQMPWPQYQRDARHSGLATEPLAGSPIASEFFPASRAYNWPNPVYDGMTHIRYFVKENAAVTIKVFDLAGDLVKELSGPGIGGVDNEVEWNVGDVQSGIYFARIEANGASGNGVAVVKVAVVK